MGRAALGRRPGLRDLDRIAAHMRRRLETGRTAQPFDPPRLPAEVVLRRVRALQLRKLRRTIAYVGRHLPFYQRALRAAGIEARSIRSLEDLRRLPITRREDIEEKRDEFISRAPGMTPAVVFKTNGTTGRPLELFLTPDEFDYYVSVQAISGMALGFLGPEHILQVHLSLDTSLAARIFCAAAEKAGSLVLNLGVTGDLDRSLESLLEERTIPGKRVRVSGLFGAPGQLWGLAARAEERGLGPSDFGLGRIFSCGAKVSEGLKRRVQRVFGQPLREGYSMVETPGTGAFECESGRLHFLDLSGLVEFLDPETEQPVPLGQPGVAVVSTFYPERELMPVLRYWSQDLMIPSSQAVCECGMASTLIDDILGRTDDMVVLGARNIYPQSLGDPLIPFSELVQPPRYSLRIEERERIPQVIVEVECTDPPSGAEKAALEARILAALPISADPYITSGTYGCEVQLVSSGGIAKPFRYKLQGPAIYPTATARE